MLPPHSVAIEGSREWTRTGTLSVSKEGRHRPIQNGHINGSRRGAPHLDQFHAALCIRDRYLGRLSTWETTVAQIDKSSDQKDRLTPYVLLSICTGFLHYGTLSTNDNPAGTKTVADGLYWRMMCLSTTSIDMSPNRVGRDFGGAKSDDGPMSSAVVYFRFGSTHVRTCCVKFYRKQTKHRQDR